MRVESIYNPIHVGMRVAAVGPKNPELVKAIAINNPVNWKRPPYIHEWALVQAYFGLDERNGHLDEKYSRDMMFVLNWVRSLHFGNFAHSIKPHRRPPLFLDKKDELLNQVANVKENSPESRIMLDYFLNECVFILANEGIFDSQNFMNPGEIT